MPIGQQDPLDMLMLLFTILGKGSNPIALPGVNRTASSNTSTPTQTRTPYIQPGESQGGGFSNRGEVAGYGRAPSFGEMTGLGRFGGGLLGKAIDTAAKMATGSPIGPIGLYGLGQMVNNAIVSALNAPEFEANPIAKAPTLADIQSAYDYGGFFAGEAARQAREDANRSFYGINNPLGMDSSFGGFSPSGNFGTGESGSAQGGTGGGGGFGSGDPGMGGAGTDRAKGGVDVANRPTTLRIGETPASRGEVAVTVPPGMLAPGVQQNEPQVVNTMQQLLGRLEGGQQMNGQDPLATLLTYGAGADAGNYANLNILDKLAFIGQQMLLRRGGVPYEDPVKAALARATLTESVRKMMEERAALQAAGGTPEKIFEPKIDTSYVPTGEFDETRTEYMKPFQTRTYSPAQKWAARTRYNVNLEDTNPLEKARFEESVAYHRTARENAEQTRLLRQATEDRQTEELQRRKELDAEKKKMDEANLRQKIQAGKAAIYNHGLQLEYSPDQISRAVSSSIDPTTGEVDLEKMYTVLDPGKKSPKAQRIEKEHQQHLNQMEQRLNISRDNAARVYANTKDADGYRQYQAAVRQWEQQFKAFQGDLSNIGRPFPLPVPNPVDYMTPSPQQLAPTRKPTLRDLRENDDAILDQILHGPPASKR